jgi:beta-glucanase (GH16 family)
MRFPSARANARRGRRTRLAFRARTPLILAVAAALALAGGLATASPSANKCSPFDPDCSGLLFADDFDGPAGAQPGFPWAILGGTNPPRWGVECFVDDQEHVSMDGEGNLVLTATYNPGGSGCTNGAGPYESGGIATRWGYRYGTAEARIKVPCASGTGLWPAWWSYGRNWPDGGEIDNLEVMRSGTPTPGQDVQQTIHGPTSSGGAWQIGNDYSYAEPLCNAFHTYGSIWEPGKIQFTFDGTVTRTIRPSDLNTNWTWPFDDYPERILLDLQVGDFGGTVDNSELPDSMLIDYVRVYR